MTHATYDVLVAGGGLVGTASAYYLASRGARVLLIERHELNRQASGQNAGSLHFQMEQRLVEHGDALAEQAATIIPLLLDAIGRWGAITAHLGETDLDVVLHGGLMIAETPEQVARLERKRMLEEKWGLPTRIVDADEVRRVAPYLSKNVVAASFCPPEGHGNPRLITAAFARAAIKAGAEIRTWTNLHSLFRDGGRWRAAIGSNESAAEVVHANAVLNAAGAWSGEVAALANLHLPIFPVALTMNAIEAGPPLVSHLIQHAGKRLSMKQLREGNVLVGGGWSARLAHSSGGFITTKPPLPKLESIYGNLSTAVSVVPALAERNLLRSWTGIVGVTADQLPLLGEVPQAPGFFVAAGGSAFTLGPTYAAMMAELITTGQTHLPIDLYSPKRFGHINMFMG